MKEAKFFEHVERSKDAALGVRVVEWLKLAYCKDAPAGWSEVVVYRPLDQEAYVYKIKGGWDFRPLGEFMQRYHPVMDDKRIAELEALSAKIYDPRTWAEFRFDGLQKKA